MLHDATQCYLPVDAAREAMYELTLVDAQARKKQERGYDSDDLTIRAYIVDDGRVYLPRYYHAPGMLALEAERRPERVAIEDRVTLRPDQAAAWGAMVAGGPDGVLNLAPGRGKTVLALKYAARVGGPVLVIAHTNELLEQWRERIAQFTGVTDVGRIQGPECDCRRAITLGSLRSLALKRYRPEICSYFRLVIFDEVDVMNARLMSRVLSMFHGARLGLTATLTRPDGYDRLTALHCGPVLYSDLEQDLKPVVYFQDTGIEWGTEWDEDEYLFEYGPMEDSLNTARLTSDLALDEDRNGLILDTLGKCLKCNPRRRVLVLGERVGQLELLYHSFEWPDKGLVHGTRAKNERLDGLDRQVIFATGQLARRGLDRVRLDTLLILSTYSSRNNLTQAVGRIQRRADKEQPVVVIFEDRGMGYFRTMGYCMRRTLRGLGLQYKDVGRVREGRASI